MKIFSFDAESMFNDLEPVMFLPGEELIFSTVKGVGV